MLKMPQQQYIKFLRENEDCSITEIADHMKIHWRTAKRYADRENWSKDPLQKRSCRSPIMGPFMHIVDTWLEEDSLVPRKQRHTGVRIFERLKLEHKYTGSQRTVLAYVKQRKLDMKLSRAQTYERLEHPPGEAQVDFTSIQVCQGTQLLTYKLLIVSFPFSNAAFVYPTPAENQECFLHALQQCFTQMGGVPRRIWFDNLSAAVVHIGQAGERKLTEGFERFCAHFRFEAVFCNPYSGHEKGNVESKCGYAKRNWAVPLPVYENHEQLAGFFAEQAKQDRQRTHYAHHDTTIEELWERDRKVLLSLPEDAFDMSRLHNAVVNKYGEIRVDKLTIPLVNLAPPGTEVLVQAYWDRWRILTKTHTKLLEIPRPYTGRTMDIPWQQVFTNWQRKPRSVTHSQFTRMLPEAVQRYLLVEDLLVRKERLEALIHWIELYAMEHMASILEQHGEETTIVQLTAALGVLKPKRDIPTTWTETLSPPGTQQPEGLRHYDCLMGVS